MSDESNTIAEETTLNEESPTIITSSPLTESYNEVQQEPTEPNPQNLPDLGDSSPSVPAEGLEAHGGDLNEVGIDNIPPSESPKTENTLNSANIEPEKNQENQPLSSDSALADKQNEAIIEPISVPVVEPTPQIPVNEALSEHIDNKPESTGTSSNSVEPEKIETSTIPEVKNEPEPEPKPKPKPQTTEAKPPVVTSINFALALLVKARNAIQTRKRKKLEKIMTLFAKQKNITNDEVEKFLHVSDATATRYLGILKKEGKIKQNGKTGKGVSYSKI